MPDKLPPYNTAPRKRHFIVFVSLTAAAFWQRLAVTYNVETKLLIGDLLNICNIFYG